MREEICRYQCVHVVCTSVKLVTEQTTPIIMKGTEVPNPQRSSAVIVPVC